MQQAISDIKLSASSSSSSSLISSSSFERRWPIKGNSKFNSIQLVYQLPLLIIVVVAILRSATLAATQLDIKQVAHDGDRNNSNNLANDNNDNDHQASITLQQQTKTVPTTIDYTTNETTIHVNQGGNGGGGSGGGGGTTTSKQIRDTEPTHITEFQNNRDDHDDGEAENVTMIINYDQQGYTSNNLTTLAISNTNSTAALPKIDRSPSSSSSGPIVKGITTTTTLAPDNRVDRVSAGQYGKRQLISSSQPKAAADDGDDIDVNADFKTSLDTNERPEAAKLIAAAESSTVVVNNSKRSENQDSVAHHDANHHRLETTPETTIKPRTATTNRDNNNNTTDARYNVNDLMNSRNYDKKKNSSSIYEILFKKKPYSKFWSIEQKWDDIFKRFIAIQGIVKSMVAKTFLKDVEYFAEVAISPPCLEDIKFIQDYSKHSTNLRWLTHMADSFGKSESGMLTGNVAYLGHVIQCIKARAPIISTNDTIDEKYFEEQTRLMGERFRGKYCLASIRPVLPEKPHLVSRFSELMNVTLLSNISYAAESSQMLKIRSRDYSAPRLDNQSRTQISIDQKLPFESELFERLILQRNFMYSLPKFQGVCYPSSCTKDDIQTMVQIQSNEDHQVVDIEFECEVEEHSAWDWFITPRLIAYVFLALIVSITFFASLIRFIIIDRMNLKKVAETDGRLKNLIEILDLLSLDKCAGILFIKTKKASPIVDETKIENERSTSIDALKGFLILILIYSELVHLGCLPLPFMWSKWVDSMFPFYRSPFTQIFLNTSIWSESFYMISAYLITAKLLENHRTSPTHHGRPLIRRIPDFTSYLTNRYIRLVLPTIGFLLMNYIWPRLSNGVVFQDQSNKILTPCDSHGWANLLLFNNHNHLNETCLWPTHVAASFFQLHLLSYPLIILLIFSLRTEIDSIGSRRFINKLLTFISLSSIILLAILGLLYSAYQASSQELIVPFLIDYIDYDNYARVIEWTVMPTHNHLTSYMFGILLAYIVIRKRSLEEESKMKNYNQWNNVYLQREGSFESVSVITSSTQELSNNRSIQLTIQDGGDKSNNDEERLRRKLNLEQQQQQQSSSGCCSTNFLIGTLIMILCLVSLLASSYWNSLGQPMDSNQTFWFMCGTKLAFNLGFAYLFYKHFATRRNSINPWMITRFLVPIGRMSLMAFYVSWLVIWFDLLSSLYQWHPSHYFILEKFNEIIFMTLILSMFAYGTFEGASKRMQYISLYNERKASNKKSIEQQQQQDNNNKLQLSSQESLVVESSSLIGFHNLFKPLNTSDGTDSQTNNSDNDKVEPSQEGSATAKVIDNKMLSKSSMVQLQPGFGGQQQQQPFVSTVTIGSKPNNDADQHLSIADQYKLNAELRANYSFASIGLYESAGASADYQSTTPGASRSGERI